MLEALTSFYAWSKTFNVSMSLNKPRFRSLQVGFLDQVCSLQSGVGIRSNHGCVVVHNGFHIFIFGIVLEILKLQSVHERLQRMVSVIRVGRWGGPTM